MDDLTAFEIRTVPALTRGTFHFDAARYDAASDVIHLASGPDAASVVERSPEGFVLRIDAVENRVIGLEITNARRLMYQVPDSPIEVTIGPGQRLAFDPADLRRIMSGGRFARRTDPDDPAIARAHDLTVAKAAAAKRFER